MENELALIGLLLSLLYIIVTRYYPGGIIVPSYLVLFINQPLRLLGTLVVSILAFLLYRLISRYTILYGVRRFTIILLSGGMLSFLMAWFVPSMVPAAVSLRVIGWVIPGLVANNYERQGIPVTLASLVIVMAATYFAGELYFVII